MPDKKEMEKTKKTEGQVRGVALKTDAEYVMKRKGREGVKTVEDKLKEHGFEMDYKSIKNTDWYPLSFRVASLLVIKDTFNWNDEQITDMGYMAPKRSFFIKTLLKFFVSVERTVRETSKYWNKHYSRGELLIKKIDIAAKQIIIELKNFKVHPVLCAYYKGYFRAVLELITPAEEGSVKEVQCEFNEDDSHCFFFEWQ